MYPVYVTSLFISCWYVDLCSQDWKAQFYPDADNDGHYYTTVGVLLFLSYVHYVHT